MLKHRLITGLSIAAGFLIILLLLPAWTHVVLLYAIFLFAHFEFYGMIKYYGYRYEVFITTICGVIFLTLITIESPMFTSQCQIFKINGNIDLSTIIMCFTPAVLLAAGVFRRKIDKAIEAFAFSLAGFWYVAVFLSFIAKIAFEWTAFDNGSINYTGRLMILVFIALVKLSDVGAYTVGMAIGKHRLIPKISPLKSVEGLFGGYLFSIATGIIIWALASRFGNGCLGDVRFSIVHAIALPILLTTTSVIGDLSESLMKRAVNIKNSSGLFPGMGGILDVLDSLFFSAPFMYIYMLLYLK